jgi:hypothetical protein
MALQTWAYLSPTIGQPVSFQISLAHKSRNILPIPIMKLLSFRNVFYKPKLLGPMLVLSVPLLFNAPIYS